jgi:uncharacterized protein with GYD domain
MPLFVLLTRISTEAIHQPRSFDTLERHVIDRVRAECPEAKWVNNYAVMGPWDYLDVFDAPDIATAMRVSVLVRTYGHAHTEVWPAMHWSDFRTITRAMPGKGEAHSLADAP